MTTIGLLLVVVALVTAFAFQRKLVTAISVRITVGGEIITRKLRRAVIRWARCEPKPEAEEAKEGKRKRGKKSESKSSGDVANSKSEGIASPANAASDGGEGDTKKDPDETKAERAFEITLRVALLLGLAYAAFRVFVAWPWIGVVLSLLCGIAAWVAGAPDEDQEQRPVDDDIETPGDREMSPREELLRWLRDTIGDDNGIHLRDLYPLLAEALPSDTPESSLTNPALRAMLDHHQIPIRDRMSARGVDGRTGVHRGDVEEALRELLQALPAPTESAPSPDHSRATLGRPDLRKSRDPRGAESGRERHSRTSESGPGRGASPDFSSGLVRL
ncbi:hypothetical protein ACFV5N_00795 [Streptomyces sp. NPDC059853]|uniref:hypothetical protein n=1 Tax=Streptomyces sp. NPDC059853 TaxID=3346973 RepID=UPI003654886C